MLGAVGRFLKTLSYAVTGRINKISEIWEEDPHVVSEKFNKIIEEKKARHETVIRAVSRLMTAADKKKSRLENYKKELQEKEKLLQGIKIAGKNRVDELKQNGKSVDEIKTDEKISSFSTKTTETNAAIETLKTEFESLDNEIKYDSEELQKFEVDLKQMQVDFSKLTEERDKALLKLTTAQGRQEAAKLKAGPIDNDKTNQILHSVRETVKNVENRTKLVVDSSIDLKDEEEDKFIALAESGGDDSFFSDIGLDSGADSSAPDKKKKEAKDDKYDE